MQSLTTSKVISLPCPLGCTRTVAAEGKCIHYCVIRTGKHIDREYVGTLDGVYVCAGGSNIEVETQLNDHVLSLIQDGLVDTPLALLDEPPGVPGEDTDPSAPPDSAVRTHLTYGHLRRDLFAPTYFCACGAQATIVCYGLTDTFFCDRCHADPTPSEPSPGLEDNDDGMPNLPNMRTLVPAVRTTARQWLAEDWRRDAEARAWSAGLLEAHTAEQ